MPTSCSGAFGNGTRSTSVEMFPERQPQPISPQPYFAPLGGRGVGVAVASCIAVRSAQAGCRDCADACPVDALSVSDDGPNLTMNCIGCGRCAATCRTGALKVEDFVASLATGMLDKVDGARPLTIACWKMPRNQAALRVPCLHGVSPSDWLRLIEAGAMRGGLTVCDVGWCASCDAAKGIEGFPVLNQVADWAAGLGVPAMHLPVIRRIALAENACPVEIPRAVDTVSVTRRGFLQRIVDDFDRRTAKPLMPTPAGAGAVRRWARSHLPEREALLAAMRRIRARHQGIMPRDAVFGHLTVSDACCGSEVCVGICPTGALARYQTETASGIEMDSDRCTACGLCARHCPNHAIELVAGTPHRQASGYTAISARRLVRCIRCEADFSPQQGQTVCPRCEADMQMARGLFGAPSESRLFTN